MEFRLLPIALIFMSLATDIFAQADAAWELNAICPAEKPNTACKTIAAFLSSKAFNGGAVHYTEKDILETTVPENVRTALQPLGVSHYALLRNEIIARHGYKFQNVYLQTLFSQATWYQQVPGFSLAQLSLIERKNMDFIKSIEDTYDYKVIGNWLSLKGRFSGDTIAYSHEGDFRAPNDVNLALNHLYTSPARLLTNEYFARHGYIFKDPVISRMFESTDWYVKRSTDEVQVAAEMNDTERLNIELLKLREWYELLSAVKITLPPDTVSIPTLGYGAMYIRTLPRGAESYYFSSPQVYSVLEADTKNIDDHHADPESLVSPEIVERIKTQQDPYRKIALFLQYKKYAGYVDTVFFNHTDFAPPSYLRDALNQTKINYYSLLRKEIQARKGAKMSETLLGRLFRLVPWYKSRYAIVPSSPTRFPPGVPFTKAELHNFGFLEGEELHQVLEKYKGENIAIDLHGNVYWVRTDKASIGSASMELPDLGKGFSSKPEFENTSIQTVVEDVIMNHKNAALPMADEEGCF